jgi:DNA polymerase III sliding clamp (beta) subunit (PCNA family)
MTPFFEILAAWREREEHENAAILLQDASLLKYAGLWRSSMVRLVNEVPADSSWLALWDCVEVNIAELADRLVNADGAETLFGVPERFNPAIALDMLPKQPKGKAVAFDVELDAVDKVLLAAGKQDLRYYLNGVCFDLTEGVMAGTDGHRLHIYKNRLPKLFGRKPIKGMPSREPVHLVVPRAPLAWLLRSESLSATMTVWNALGENTKTAPGLPEFLLQSDDAFVWVRKPIEGKYPDYSRVVPVERTRPTWVMLDPEVLSEAAHAMGRASLKVSKKYNSIRLDFSQGAVVANSGTASAAVKFAFFNQAGPVENLALVDGNMWLGLNADYLQDLADCVTKDALWRPDMTHCSNNSLMVTDGDFVGVVMPQRIFNKGEDVAREPLPAAKVDLAAAFVAAEAVEDAAEADIEPCPAAVDAMVAQLVGKARESAKTAPKVAKNRAVKASKVARPELVAA